MLLNDFGVNNTIKTEINKFFETNEYKDTIYWNLCDTAKAVGGFPHLKREAYSDKCPHQKVRSQVNNLTLHLEELEKQEHTNPKANRRQEVSRIRGELKKTEE